MQITFHAKERIKERFKADFSLNTFRNFITKNKHTLQRDRYDDSKFTMLGRINGREAMLILSKNLTLITVLDLGEERYEDWCLQQKYGGKK
jgi:hypothetical protein